MSTLSLSRCFSNTPAYTVEPLLSGLAWVRVCHCVHNLEMPIAEKHVYIMYSHVPEYVNNKQHHLNFPDQHVQLTRNRKLICVVKDSRIHM